MFLPQPGSETALKTPAVGTRTPEALTGVSPHFADVGRGKVLARGGGVPAESLETVSPAVRFGWTGSAIRARHPVRRGERFAGQVAEQGQIGALGR
jgi:hypothetical protein